MHLSTSHSPSDSQPLRVTVRPLLWVGVVVFVAAALLYGTLNTGLDFFTVVGLFSTRFLGIYIEAVPFLLMGTFTSGLIEAFVRHDDLMRVMPRNRYLATGLGAFLGLVFPVCECGVVPVARRLFTKGLPASVGITFLLAAPFMNPIVFASTFIAFGWGVIFVGRFVITALVAISVGLMFALTARDEDVLLPTACYVPNAAPPPPRATWRSGFTQTLTVATSEFFEIGRYLVIGCLLAAGMQTFIPQETLLRIGSGQVGSVLAMQAFAFILSVCSTVDSFLALAFVNTFTTGAILAFLSFGPMVDVKSTLLFLGVFKRRTVVYLVAVPFALNALAGVLVNVWLAR